MKIKRKHLAPATSNATAPSTVIQTKQKTEPQKTTQNGFVSSNHSSPVNPAPFIINIYTLLHLHFENFLRKLKVLAMPSSFTARLITLTTIIPVVSITVVVVSGPV
jgi:hypothetical protein